MVAVEQYKDQIVELKESYRFKIKVFEEGGQFFILIESVPLPEGCTPKTADLLLTPTAWGGYSSKLFYPAVISSRRSQNWNTQNVRIGDRAWNSFSWRVPEGLRLSQLLLAHMEGLR